MAEMLIEDLRRILTECAGADEEQAELGDDVLDHTLEELGYDSLAVLETTARIAQEFGVALEDGAIAGQQTLQGVLDAVNNAVARRPT